MIEVSPAFYVLAINGLAYLLYAWDKSRAQRGLYRISEGNLLFIALLGGWIGALAGCYIVRHKVRKPSFMGPLWLIAIGEAGFFIYSLLFGLPDFIVEFINQAA